MVLCQLQIPAFLLGQKRTFSPCCVCTAPSTGGLLQSPRGSCEVPAPVLGVLDNPKLPWDKTLGQPEGEQEVQSTSGAAVYLDLPSMNVMRVFSC